MSELERLRHSTAHILATAIAKLWPDAQFAAGPPVENGFYYDVDLSHRITPDDFEKIEAEMLAVVKENQVFEKAEVSREEAMRLAQSGRLAALGDVFPSTPHFLPHQIKKWNNYLGAQLKGKIGSVGISPRRSIRDLVIRHVINTNELRLKKA